VPARQGIPVIDIANLIQTILQVLNDITEISNQVQQIKQLQTSSTASTASESGRRVQQPDAEELRASRGLHLPQRHQHVGVQRA
jgi:conjugal transfer/entry exclusion protein